MSFDTEKHTMVESEDGSFTAYSSEFQEHYHSTRDGALHESLYKHVIPAFEHHKDKDELTILDICFGLGFNTLATLYYMREHNIKKRVRIFSPEFDGDLIASLRDFTYPDIFASFLPIIEALSRNNVYEDEQLYIELYIGDAREYLRSCPERFDIVYQDAFSPATNPILWTKEYFADIARLINDDGILTTYSMALKTRLALYENGFNIYINSGEGHRDATLASKSELMEYERVDMAHKIACNKGVQPLYDSAVL
jgi:tRNA U34 5-methylaminomethyl-2-thiouridine-forming methyltransferase MnmC